jgi:predicted nucleic acid binding AN1-type Zn finger protein
MQEVSMMDDIDIIFNKKLSEVNAQYPSQNINSIISDVENLSATQINTLYKFVKACQTEGVYNAPICQKAVNIIKEYEKRKKGVNV